MPRRRQGGHRAGRPGANYPNRTDLATKPRSQPVTVAAGQPYGQAGQQVAAQQALPLPANTGPVAPSAPPTAPAGPPAGPFTRPTERPGEPVTAGAPLGPGPGPEALGGMTAQESVLDQLRGVFAQYPTPELQAAIALMEAQGIT